METFEFEKSYNNKKKKFLASFPALNKQNNLGNSNIKLEKF